MKKCRRVVWTLALAVLAILQSAVAFGGEPNTAEGPEADKGVAKKMRWNVSGAEKQWEGILANPVENADASLSKRIAFSEGFDTSQANGQLESFGTRYMPNAYAQYQELRAKFLELRQMMKETFPDGAASDPTGGDMFEKGITKLDEAVLQTLRRRDELCFFLLFHQAGIFSDDVLAKFDSRPISISMEPESNAWPDDTPEANTPLSDADATFAAKYLPETLAGYQRLCGLFDAGAKQYAELRQTALALCAPRARNEFLMLKSRLEQIRSTLQAYQQDLSRQRLEHAFGDTTAEQLAAVDQANAVQIQKYEREMEVKAYVAKVSEGFFVALPGGAKMEMVWCPPGAFMMGDNDDQHQVTLTKGFWMAKTEVTQGQWKSVMGSNPSRFKGDDLPVENVSWDDCQEFCKKTGLSLPTEAQWEYACRAGTTGDYAGTGKLDDMGWYGETWDSGQTHPVGQKKPNAWGLYDMHGNVWEWCADWYGGYPKGAVTDPKGGSSGTIRVERGGGWGDSAGRCRSAARYRGYPSGRYCDLGFRPAMILSAE